MDELVQSLKDAGVMDVIKDHHMWEQLKKLAIEAGLVGADAILDHVDKNIKTVDFGNFSAILHMITSVVVQEIRKLIHKGLVVQ